MYCQTLIFILHSTSNTNYNLYSQFTLLFMDMWIKHCQLKKKIVINSFLHFKMSWLNVLIHEDNKVCIVHFSLYLYYLLLIWNNQTTMLQIFCNPFVSLVVSYSTNHPELSKTYCSLLPVTIYGNIYARFIIYFDTIINVP